MNRRDWLKTAGGLVVGFTFSGLAALGEQVAPASQTSIDGRPLDPREVDSVLAINADGSVTVYTSKVDVGTGMRVRSRRWRPGSASAARWPQSTATARCPARAARRAPGSRAEARRFDRRRDRASGLLGSGQSVARPVADLTIMGEVRPWPAERTSDRCACRRSPLAFRWTRRRRS
jgi:hypothetical protein